MKRPSMMTAYAALSASILALGLTGCAISRTWQYPPTPPGTLLNEKAAKPVSVKVAVMPFRDLRGDHMRTEHWRVAIPSYPYAVDSYDRPETAKATEGVPLIKMNPSQDFARAIADELRHAGVFSSVSFMDGTSADGADLVLNGTIRATGWRRSFTTYLLGPVGTIFWVLGAPMGNATNTVEMDVQLAPARAPSRSVWEYTMQFNDEHLIGVYYGMEESVENYSTAIQETIKPVLANLVRIAAERPEIFQAVK